MHRLDRGRGPPENRESRPAGTGAALECPFSYTRIITTKARRRQDPAQRPNPAWRAGTLIKSTRFSENRRPDADSGPMGYASIWKTRECGR
jgi:hypothetical protein